MKCVHKFSKGFHYTSAINGKKKCFEQTIFPSVQTRAYMSDCENPRFRERTSTNLGRSHRLPHVCTIMIYGKLGGYRLQETAAFIYIYM